MNARLNSPRSTKWIFCLASAIGCWLPFADASDADLADHFEVQDWTALEQFSGDINQRQPDGMTALHWAVFHGNHDAVDQLISRGVDVDVRTEYSITPLSIAIEAGDSSLTSALLAAEADVHDRLPGGHDMLMLAARSGNSECVTQLLGANAKVDTTDDRGQTALMWAAAAGHTGIVASLIEAGADLEKASRSGFTALFFASRNGQIETAKKLIEAGVDVDAVIKPRNTSGRNPRGRMSALMFAVESGHFELALILVANGADPNDQRSEYAPLHALSWVRRARKGDGVDGDPEPRGSGSVTALEFVRRLVAAGADVDLQLQRGKGGRAQLTHKGCTPFLMAAKTADLPYLKTLIAIGADPMITNADGTTALLAASGIGVKSLVDEDPGTEPEVIAAVDYLLSLGLNINAVDQNGETVMHGAAYRNYPNEVRFLYERGADPSVWNAPNKHHTTPRQIAAGRRPGAFKPSPVTVQAIDEVLANIGQR